MPHWVVNQAQKATKAKKASKVKEAMTVANKQEGSQVKSDESNNVEEEQADQTAYEQLYEKLQDNKRKRAQQNCRVTPKKKGRVTEHKNSNGSAQVVHESTKAAFYEDDNFVDKVGPFFFIFSAKTSTLLQYGGKPQHYTSMMSS